MKEQYETTLRLRVPEGMTLEPSFLNKLKITLRSDIRIEYYLEYPNLGVSYQKRQNSLLQACYLIADALIEKPQQASSLKEKAQLCYKTFNIIKNPPDSLHNHQTKLENYVNDLVNTLKSYFSDKNPKYLKKLLNKAEQYVLLKAGREDIATLIRFQKDKINGYMLLREKQLGAFHQKTLEELEHIKRSFSMSSKNDSPFQPIILPAWFKMLETTEQKFLIHCLKSTSNIQSAAFFLSSRLRTLPGMANFAEHHFFLLDTEGNTLKMFEPRLRSSHIASRDVTDKDIQDLICQRNLDMLLNISKEKPLLLQTLISPIMFSSWFLPDQFLDKQRQKISYDSNQTQTKIYSTNHPFNLAKYINYTPQGSKECASLLQLANLNNNDNSDQMSDHLIIAYANLLKSGLGTSNVFDYNGRELILSSYENLLIINANGVSYGSCVSGKDRKSIELLHTDAMYLYYMLYERWPLHSDTGSTRDNFVELAALLYMSRHFQEFAGQNAPGSDGIKTPSNYLPKDICTAITKKCGNAILEIDDILATNNEVTRIKPSQLIAYLPDCIYAARKLNEKNRIHLLSQLKIIINEYQFWQSKIQSNMKFLGFSQDSPKGIRRIKKILNEPPHKEWHHKNSLEILGHIYESILDRPDSSTVRSKDTQDLYDMLKTLCYASDPNAIFQKQLEKLKSLKELSFKENSSYFF